jgi:K+-sensing histidine kinase KdpD
MGLGLSLVRSIVEAHFGAVWAESEERVGSTIFVWLPMADDRSKMPTVKGSSGRLDGASDDRFAVEEF